MLKAYQQQNGGLKGVIVGEHDDIPVGSAVAGPVQPDAR